MTEALTPLDQTSHIEIINDNPGSGLLGRIAKRSILALEETCEVLGLGCF